MPQPPAHSWQVDATLVISPFAGDGRQAQFWLQTAVSSANFQGIGVNNAPPIAPAANCKKVRLPNFMASTLLETIPKLAHAVTPAKAGVQSPSKNLDSGFRRNDINGIGSF